MWPSARMGGIYIHLLLWLLIGWTGNLHTMQLPFFAANAGLFLANMLLRLYFECRLRAMVEQAPARAEAGFADIA